MRLEFWFLALGFFLILGTFLNLPWLMFFSTAVAFLIILADLWRKRSLHKVIYSRRWLYTRGFPGESTEVRLEVENRKRLPLSWLRATDNWPVEVPPQERRLLAPSHIVDRGLLTNLFSLRGGQKITRAYPLKFGRRGVYPVGPVELESGDFFGILEDSRTVPVMDTVTVFPEILPLSALNLPAEDPFGDRNAPRRLFEDPNRTIGVRAYHPEDELRRIHWPATARTGQMQVRMYQPVSARVLMVCLNVTITENIWMDFHIEALEQLVKIAATLSYEGLNAGYSVGLMSNGGLRSDHPYRIFPGTSQEHLALILQALAGISPLSTTTFEDFLQRTLPQIPLGATLLIVSALVTPSLAAALTYLKKYRMHTTLISIAPTTPPEIPGVCVIHLPFQA